MRTLKILSFIVLAVLAAPASKAQGAAPILGSAPALPPASIGNSFVSLYWNFLDNGSTELFYLGSDGTCMQLSDAIIDGQGLPPKYQPSQAGTYTYIPTAGNPDEATLTITTAAGSGQFILEFTGDSYGFFVAPGTSAFSFLLESPNTFLTNVSNRVTLRPTDTAVTGFVIEGTESRLVLIRTVGPTLAQFGVKPISANPTMGLYMGTGTNLLASGQRWGFVTNLDAQAMGWIFGIAGAFPLQSGSNDVVYFGVLNPGAYTVQSSDTTVSASGASALTEVYILPYSGIGEGIAPLFIL
jgi:hypothetical protein